MASQFMQAWAVDSTAITAALGSKDPKLVARACKRPLAKELREIVEEDGDATLEQQLQTLIDGKPAEAAEWHTLRCISLLADVVGKRVGTDVDLPGRGWHELGPAWAHWKQPRVAKLWETEPSWAKRLGGGWPRVMLAPQRSLPALIDQLAAFDPKSVVELGVPRKVDRFGDGEWEMTSLSEYIADLAEQLRQCTKAARRAKRDLIVWLDGQQ